MKITLLICEIGHFARDCKKGRPRVEIFQTTSQELEKLGWEPEVGRVVPPSIVSYDEMEDPPDDWRVVALFREGEEEAKLLDALLATAGALGGDSALIDHLLGKVMLAGVGLGGLLRT
jgi:hypothetical protein